MPNSATVCPGALLAIPPGIAALRVRFEGGCGRGRVQLEFWDRYARAGEAVAHSEDLGLEDAALQLLDAWQPDWAGGRPARGALLIDLASGHARLESDAQG